MWTLPPIYCGWIVTKVDGINLPKPYKFSLPEAENRPLESLSSNQLMSRPHVMAHMDKDTAMKAACRHFKVDSMKILVEAIDKPQIADGTVVVRLLKDQLIVDSV